MQYGLKEETILQIKSVFALFPKVKKVVLYGSRAIGTFKKGSDIDITLYGDNLDLTCLSKIEIAIDDLLLPYTFDVSIFKQISNPDLVDHINQFGIEFYKVD